MLKDLNKFVTQLLEMNDGNFEVARRTVRAQIGVAPHIPATYWADAMVEITRRELSK